MVSTGSLRFRGEVAGNIDLMRVIRLVDQLERNVFAIRNTGTIENPGSVLSLYEMSDTRIRPTVPTGAT